MTEIEREFQRTFEFVVKHGPKLHWGNRDIKKFLRWAWNGRHIITLHDGYFDKRRIAAIAICWQTDHPENRYEDFGSYDEKEGDYLHVYGAIVHPEYRNKNCMAMLLCTALIEYPTISKVCWNHHGRNRQGLRIVDINTLSKELLKWRTHLV